MLTKAHIDAEISDLTLIQLYAVDMLVSGHRDTETAEAVGVARETVTRWRLYNPKFRAELNKRRQEIWSSSADKLRSIFRKSLDAIEEEVIIPNGPNRGKIALEIVRLIFQEKDLMSRIGPDTPERIIHKDASKDNMDPFGPSEEEEKKTLEEYKAKMEEKLDP